MIKKCTGCGAVLQSTDEYKEGYVSKDIILDAKICKRCFRIKNYGDYQIINKDTIEYKNIFDNIKNKDNLVLFLCDIFSLDETLNSINDFKNVILVVTKCDLLPKSVKEKKLADYIKNNYDLNINNIVFISSVKNYHTDLLMNEINKYKIGKLVYLVGNTNAGKSTLLNSLIKSYSNTNLLITTSALPATTLDTINVKLTENLTIIDTPGIVDDSNYLSNVDVKDVKKITPTKEIKPRTYQMKPNQSLIIGEYARIDYISDHKNSFTLYLSNNIKVNRINLETNDYLKDLKKASFDLPSNKDIVINGLCFCKMVNKAVVNVYTKDNIKIFSRDNLI